MAIKCYFELGFANTANTSFKNIRSFNCCIIIMWSSTLQKLLDFDDAMTKCYLNFLKSQMLGGATPPHPRSLRPCITWVHISKEANNTHRNVALNQQWRSQRASS